MTWRAHLVKGVLIAVGVFVAVLIALGDEALGGTGQGVVEEGVTPAHAPQDGLSVGAGQHTTPADRNLAGGRSTSSSGGDSARVVRRAQTATVSIVPYGFDALAHAASVAKAQVTPVRPMPGARIVFVPHHAPAGHLTAGVLRDLAASIPTGDGPAWERVAVLGPDHGKVGSQPATTSAAAWFAPGGRVEGEAAAVARLVRSGVVDDNASLLSREHSIGEVVPFQAHYLPATTVVPLMVRADANRAERDRIVSALTSFVDGVTVVVVSADFAHNVAPHAARANDVETIAALVGLDAPALRAFGDEHLDARAATTIAMQLAEVLGATRFVVRDRADASEFPGYAGGAVTSYVTGYYAPP